MTSNYSSDPRVPPAKVGHLGKHQKQGGHGPVGLPAADRAVNQPVDPGPSYEDFLDQREPDEEVPDKTG